ncbi:MAG TPA: thioredoxin domain-containing protein [Methylotenera sp.]|nr:thioredoxin domain-containing protein [Methylotenera sp.]HPH05653.1 thioredoxin domain-containing protein [Methylotenera sp.]HPN01333.1 thioredoxin domain-containing protein [Methylotenera sp.]
MPNKLAEETSPYLLQHAQNPVEWYPWGEQALTLARELNKPILLSIGYSACHWCHVMAHESFEDAQTAALMNTHFINIKVDREERPDLDQIYQTAHNLFTQKSGGWPLTVFLTPNQQPYFTGTYFPKTARYQLPGFADLLPRVAAYFYEHSTEIANQTQQLARAFARTVPVANVIVTANSDIIQSAFEQLQSQFDFEHGGFGSAPKFPNPADVTLLLHQAHIGDRQAEAMALQMLTAMANGGIYDQLGGGFCRYSVDDHWNIPHFEKMLYDNGQLLCLYADGWQISKNPRYAVIVEETIEWLICEMRSPEGAFYSSLDADSVDDYGRLEEGAFYVWQPKEVKALLTPDEFIVASRCFGFDRAANFEGIAWHPYLAIAPTDDEYALLMNARTKLFEARHKRPHPARDDKILTSWNALAIKGLAHAGRVFNRADWVELAQNAVDYIRLNMWKNQTLLATCKDGKAHLNAYLDDYAYLLDALISLMQAEYRPEDMQFAQELAEALLQNFEAEEGGFYFTSHQHEQLIHRLKQAYDNATPNGNGIAAVALQRLGHILAEPRYLNSAERTLQAFDVTIKRNPSACASLMHALQEYFMPPAMVVVSGEYLPMQAWAAELNTLHYPHHLFFYLDTSKMQAQEWQKNLPVIFRKKLTKTVNATICKGVECSQSVDDLAKLLGQL